LQIKKYKLGYQNGESNTLLVGLEVSDKNFRVGYSYDAIVSNLKIKNIQGKGEYEFSIA